MIACSQVRSMFALCLAIGVYVSNAPASAQGTDDAQYSQAVSEALVEFNEHRFEEARALFLKAHAIRPNARTLRALGNVEFELRNYVECIEYLNGALAHKEQPLTANLREETSRTLGRAAAFTARVELVVEPSAAQVTVDAEAPRLQADGTLLLNIGRHEFSASSPGYLSVRRTLDVRGGEHTRLQFSLPSAEVATSGPSAKPEVTAPMRDTQQAPSSPGLLQRWWFWTALSVVVVGAGAGILVATGSGSSELQAPLPGNVGQTRMLLRGAL